jgi:hypothetical protein
MSGWLTPMEPEAEMLDHVCGKCRTPWGISNPECPNAPKQNFIPGSRFRADQFTDDALAVMVDEWKDEL